MVAVPQSFYFCDVTGDARAALARQVDDDWTTFLAARTALISPADEEPTLSRQTRNRDSTGAARIDLELSLEDPRQLFVADPDFFFESANVRPGIEQLYEELRWRELDKPVRTTLRLPRRAIEPGLPDKIGDAIRRYCAARRHRVQNELRALLRDGVRALALGLVLLAVALAVSVAIRRSPAPESIRIFFGDGVFLVAAWVGMWYPLDTLVYTPRPLRRERAVLDAMSRMEVAIVASDE